MITQRAETVEQLQWRLKLEANRHLVHLVSIATNKKHGYSDNQFFEKLGRVESLTEAQYLILSLKDMPEIKSRPILYDCMGQFFGQSNLLNTCGAGVGGAELQKHIREKLGNAMLEVFFHFMPEMNHPVPRAQGIQQKICIEKPTVSQTLPCMETL